MRIETIRVKNYKVFKDLELRDLPQTALFVGANGTGKSTLFDIFSFLCDALQHNVKQALNKRGGFKEVISRGGHEFIEMELQFRLPILQKERLVTYFLKLGEEKGAPRVEREFLRYKRGPQGSPFHFLDFKRGRGSAILNEEDFYKEEKELKREKHTLDSPDILAIKGLGQFERFKAASAFRKFIENWHVSDFHISEARPSREAGYAEHLSPTGDNLPLTAQYLDNDHRERFQKVLEKMKEHIPGISSVEAKDILDGRIILRFQDQTFQDPFIARHVSDGTIKMFAYLILLHDPHPHPLLCIEEPENQLYPTLLLEILEEFRQYAQRGGQVFLTSHSPDLLNGADLKEVYWLQKERGFSTVKRASEAPQLEALLKEGEKPGCLWNQNFFSGSHPSGLLPSGYPPSKSRPIHAHQEKCPSPIPSLR